MQVKILYEAQARRAAETREEAIELPETASLSECIRCVADRHGNPLQSILMKSDGGIQPSLLIFVNDGHVASGTEIALSDGDTVTLMTPISGG